MTSEGLLTRIATNSLAQPVQGVDLQTGIQMRSAKNGAPARFLLYIGNSFTAYCWNNGQDGV